MVVGARRFVMARFSLSDAGGFDPPLGRRFFWYRRFRQIQPAKPRQPADGEVSAKGDGLIFVLTETVGYLVIAGLGCLVSVLWHGYSLLTLLGLILLSAGALLSAAGALIWYRRSRHHLP